MAPKQSLARARKHVLDRVARGVITMVEAASQLGVSRSRLYELRHRYWRYGLSVASRTRRRAVMGPLSPT